MNSNKIERPEFMIANDKYKENDIKKLCLTFNDKEIML